MLQYQVEYYGKTDWCTIHIDTSLEVDQKLIVILELKSIVGIVNIKSEKYQYIVEKAKLFKWDQILPRVIELLSQHYGEAIEICSSQSD
jgi:hypothetical protein